MAAEVQGVARVADTLNHSARASAAQLHAVFAAAYDGPFSLVSPGVLAFQGHPVAGDFSVVDQFARTTGGVATVFVRQGDDFLRVSTSVQRADGSRAVQTLLGAKHPAHARLLQGSDYVGPAHLFGKPYMTRYTPIKDGAGAVIGVLFVGFDMSGLRQAQAEQAEAVKLFDSGGIYLLDPGSEPAQAVLRAHPAAKGQLLADLLGAAAAQAWLAALQGADAAAPVPAAAVLHREQPDVLVQARREAAHRLVDRGRGAARRGAGRAAPVAAAAVGRRAGHGGPAGPGAVAPAGGLGGAAAAGLEPGRRRRGIG
jgi:methyl-accepting chemotaxis protein